MKERFHHLFSTPRRACLVALLLVLGFVAGFGLHYSLVSAQVAQVRVTELQCSSDPETVAITNQGASAQDLTGWSLKSDPVATETFDLTPVGVLAPGVTVFVESGPSASGTFVWSTNFIFRDGDPTDFVRIVDNTSTVVQEVNCQGTSSTPSAAPAAAPTGTPVAPTSTPTRAPTPAPTQAPAGNVPDGGGPPAPSSGTFIVFMLAAGLLAIGAGSMTVLTASPAGARAKSGDHAPGFPASGRARAEGLFPYLLLLAVFAVAAQVLGSRRRR